jgi:uncharacterized protein (TIGR03435 family)
VSGGPGWADSDLYQVDAKAAGNASLEARQSMMQTLLAERFKLVIHREVKQLPAYVLTPAKRGLKLQPPKDGSCFAFDPNSQALPTPPPPPPAAGTPVATPCGRVMFMISPSEVKLQGGKVAMPELVRMLSTILGRAVIDKTGFAGAFDVRLQFGVDSSIAGFPGFQGPPIPAGDSAAPPIFVAMQEQLGIKMESGKSPVEVLIVDHVERPSEN